MAESRQQWLARNRKPRVHITMDVETEDGIKKVELPFVIGVIGDFSGDRSADELKPLKERNFIRIDKDNFDEVMRRIEPQLAFKVENTLGDGDTQLSVNLKFTSLDDFDPANVARQIEPLRKLLEKRNQLQDLSSQVDRSDKLESMLEQILSEKEKTTLKNLKDSRKPESADEAEAGGEA